MPGHSIRLHGPWSGRVYHSDHGSADVTPRSFQAPNLDAVLTTDDGHGGPRDRLQLERSFHCPTGLDDSVEVVLAVDTSFAGELQFNGSVHPLATAGRHRLPVSSQLRPRNRLIVDLVIDSADPIGQPKCDVRLEIVPK